MFSSSNSSKEILKTLEIKRIIFISGSTFPFSIESKSSSFAPINLANSSLE